MMIDRFRMMSDPYLKALSPDKGVQIVERIQRWGVPATFDETLERWFGNFDAADKDLALKLFLHLDYYSPARFDARLRDLRDRLTRRLIDLGFDSARMIVVTPESALDSANRHVYDLGKAWQLPASAICSVAQLERTDLRDAVIVLFNDTHGSGNQFLREMGPTLQRVGSAARSVFITAVAVAAEAHQRFRDALPAAHVIPQEPAFSARNAFTAAELARLEEIGRRVYPKHPLGFGGTALLTVYYFQCPNNSLPVIWADGTNNRTKSGTYPWSPLVPYRPKPSERGGAVESPFSDPAAPVAPVGPCESSAVAPERPRDVAEILQGYARSVLSISNPHDDLLFVPRDRIERQVTEALSGSCVLISLEGEAGTGKSVTLRKLHERLSSEASRDGAPIPLWIDCVWFAETVRPSETPLGAVLQRLSRDAGDVWKAIGEVRRHVAQLGRRFIVLLDTMDVVLLSQARTRWAYWLENEAPNLGLSVVMTCRPSEAGALPSRRRIVRQVDFDENEVELAIERYVGVYLGDLHDSARAEAVERLHARYLRDPRLAEICRHPVTLRLFFEAYRGEVPPGEIDPGMVFRVYVEKKIVSPARPVSALRAKPGARRRFAFDLARTMLELRSTSLTRHRLEELLLRHEDGEAAYQDLLGECVLRSASVNGSQIEFFHQSLMEHLAARAVLHSGDVSSVVAELLRPLRERGHEPPWFKVLQEIAVQAAADLRLASIADEVEAALRGSEIPGALTCAATILCLADRDPHERLPSLADRSFRRACEREVHNARPERQETILNELNRLVLSDPGSNPRREGARAEELALFDAWANCAPLIPGVVASYVESFGLLDSATRRDSEVRDADRNGYYVQRLVAILTRLFGTSVGGDALYQCNRLYRDLERSFKDASMRADLVRAVARRLFLCDVAWLLLAFWATEIEVRRDGTKQELLRNALGEALAPLPSVDAYFEGAYRRARRGQDKDAAARASELLKRWYHVVGERVAREIVPLPPIPRDPGEASDYWNILVKPLCERVPARMLAPMLRMLCELETTPGRRHHEKQVVLALTRCVRTEADAHHVLSCLTVSEETMTRTEMQFLVLRCDALLAGTPGYAGLPIAHDARLSVRRAEVLVQLGMLAKCAEQILAVLDQSLGDDQTECLLRTIATARPAFGPPEKARVLAWVLRCLTSPGLHIVSRAFPLVAPFAADLGVPERVAIFVTLWSWMDATKEPERRRPCAEAIVDMLRHLDTTGGVGEDLWRRGATLALEARQRDDPDLHYAASRMLRQAAREHPNEALAMLRDWLSGWVPHVRRADRSPGLGVTVAIRDACEILGGTMLSSPVETWDLACQFAALATSRNVGRSGWDSISQRFLALLRIGFTNDAAKQQILGGLPEMPDAIVARALALGRRTRDDVLFDAFAEVGRDRLGPQSRRVFEDWGADRGAGSG